MAMVRGRPIRAVAQAATWMDQRAHDHRIPKTDDQALHGDRRAGVQGREPEIQAEAVSAARDRKKAGFDFDLPGEGLLVWKVDEPKEQNDKTKSGLSIVQADGSNDLDNPNDGNQGDAGDPFPGEQNHSELSDVGIASTSFPGTRSGISFKNIKLGDNGVITLDVAFEGEPGAQSEEACEEKGKEVQAGEVGKRRDDRQKGKEEKGKEEKARPRK